MNRDIHHFTSTDQLVGKNNHKTFTIGLLDLQEQRDSCFGSL